MREYIHVVKTLAQNKVLRFEAENSVVNLQTKYQRACWGKAWAWDCVQRPRSKAKCALTAQPPKTSQLCWRRTAPPPHSLGCSRWGRRPQLGGHCPPPPAASPLCFLACRACPGGHPAKLLTQAPDICLFVATCNWALQSNLQEGCKPHTCGFKSNVGYHQISELQPAIPQCKSHPYAPNSERANVVGKLLPQRKKRPSRVTSLTGELRGLPGSAALGCAGAGQGGPHPSVTCLSAAACKRVNGHLGTGKQSVARYMAPFSENPARPPEKTQQPWNAFHRFFF